MTDDNDDDRDVGDGLGLSCHYNEEDRSHNGPAT